MRRSTIRFFAGVCVFLVLSAASMASQEDVKETLDDSGNAFLRICSVLDQEKLSAAETSDALACFSFVTGVWQGVEVEIEYAKLLKQTKPARPYCVPGTVEYGQYGKIVLKYIRNHPEQAQLMTAQLVMLALRDAFPCRA